MVAFLSLSEIKSEHAEGVIRREFVSGECTWQPEHPSYRRILEICPGGSVTLPIRARNEETPERIALHEIGET